VLQTLFVGIIGGQELAQAVKSGALAAPALGPVRLELGGLLGILEGVIPVLLGGMGSGPVAVKDVVLGVEGNGFGELFAATRSGQRRRGGKGRKRE